MLEFRFDDIIHALRRLFDRHLIGRGDPWSAHAVVENNKQQEKMSSKSKTKGSNGERELCRIMTEIFGGSFVRVPSSGAQVGGSNIHRLSKYSDVQGRAFRGDIIPPDHLPNLYVESKAYKGFRFHQLLQPSGCPVLDAWIKQAADGRLPTDVMFVCFKINLLGWFVAVPEIDCPAYVFENYCSYNGPHGPVRVTEMKGFFQTNHGAISKKANSV